MKHNTGCSTKPALWMHKEQQLDADFFLIHHHRLQQHATLAHWTAIPLLRKHEPITKVKLIFSIIGNAV